MTGNERRQRAGRRGGQALVEFTLALPLVLLLIFSCVELSRVLNVYVSLNRICQRAALDLAAPDVTSSRPPTEAVRSLRRQLRAPGRPLEWNPAYAPLAVALARADMSQSFLRVHVNEERDGKLFSTVEVQVRISPLILPTLQTDQGELGRLTMIGRALAMNETQSPRRSLQGRYQPMTIPLEAILESPDAPLPENIPVRGEGTGSALFTGLPDEPAGAPAGEAAELREGGLP